MKNKIIVAFFIFSLFLITSYISAQESDEPNIQFPVAELGNCENKEACKTYCDNPDNIRVCVAFAEKHGLMNRGEAERAKKLADLGSGPGGCRGKDQCEQFCSNTNNMEVCLEFAEKHGFLDQKELEESRRVLKVLKEGGSLPGSCTNKLECESYCANPSNAEECLSFAEKAGFIPKEEVERARKFIPLMQKGETPGGCKSKEECESYCHEEANMETCAEFAPKVGAMNQEEYDRFKKTGGKGPGGCKGEECRDFCNNPSNQEVCLEFAQEHGFIEKGEVDEIRKGGQQLKEHFQNIPPEVVSCLDLSIGADKFQSIRNGEIVPGPELGQAMRQCFEANMKEGPEGEGQHPGSEGEMMKGEGEFQSSGRIQGGPGGCSSPEECRTYCQEHEEECRRPMMNQQPQEFNQPMPQDPNDEFRQEGQPNMMSHNEDEYRKMEDYKPIPMPPGEFKPGDPNEPYHNESYPPQNQPYDQTQPNTYNQPIPYQGQEPPPDYQQYQQPQYEPPPQDGTQYNQPPPPPPPPDFYSEPPPVSLYLDNNFIGLITKFLLAR